MDRRIAAASAIIVLILIATGLTVIYFRSVSTEPSLLLFEEYGPSVAGEAFTVASIFNLVCPTASQALATGLTTDDTVVLQIARFLSENPYAAENLFSAALHRSINLLDPSLHGDSMPLLTSDTVNATFTSIGTEAALFMAYYVSRSTCMYARTAINVETTQSSQRFLVSFFCYQSPIVMDMDGDGVLQASLGQWLPHPDSWSTNIRAFDLNGDGLRELMDWVGPNDGLLVGMSSGEASSITGVNLFGDADGWSNGFAKLSLLDVNHDGVLQGSELDGLYVWQDTSQDAVAQSDEVRSLSDAGVTVVSLNQHNSISSFVINGTQRTLWDWYPNTLLVLGLHDGPVVDSPPELYANPIAPVQSATMGHNITITNSQMGSLGLAGARLACLSNSGAAILVDKISNVSLEASGYHYAIVAIHGDESGDPVVQRVPLKVSDITDVIPIDDSDAVMVIANGGTKILQVDLSSSSPIVLFENDLGCSGFRAGGQSVIVNDTLYNWGAFYSSDGELTYEGVVSIPLHGGNLSLAVNTGSIFSSADIPPVEVSITGPNSIFAVGRSENITLMRAENESLVEFDTAARFGGIWSGLSHVLYLTGTAGEDIYSVKIYNSTSGSITTIATGPYSFPVLSQNGVTGVFAEYSLSTRTMTYYVATSSRGHSPAVLLNDVPIGPLRISHDGTWYAYLSTDGLVIGRVTV